MSLTAPDYCMARNSRVPEPVPVVWNQIHTFFNAPQNSKARVVDTTSPCFLVFDK
jgi:hypothetical protein